MSETTEKRSLLARFGRWVAELILVFVGVYAAFWLNNYQEHRQDAERRDQILASFEQQLREGIESGRINRAKQEREATEFQRALNAGEMPPVRPFVFTTDYSPSDWATMLQSGGVQLLDVQTLMAVRCAMMNQLSAGIESHGAVPKIERRVDRAESGPGHFLLLRPSHEKIAKTLRNLSRSSGCKGEIRKCT